MRDVESHSVDMVLADLPYGTTKNKWDSVIDLNKLWEQYERIIKEHGVIALFGDEPFASELRISNKKLYRYDWIWIKSNPTGFLNANRMPLKNTETISIFYKKLPLYNPQMTGGKPYNVHNNGLSKNYGKYTTNYSTDNHGTRYPLKTIRFNGVINNGEKRFHPTQKPIALLEYLIRTYTDPKMTVLDNVMGSGSTGVACANLNRSFIGMEKDKKYFDIANERINSAKSQADNSLF
ncbi:DNA-methyltransferase [Lactobacillus hominis]|uniref:DNA-methyltransferase n=1 Tax=Lactobacillus hominis TaxID=1203033 RepID=UPI001F32877A|nr:site-specific DNA-methyltransferase [Lactobacillus hominis]